MLADLNNLMQLSAQEDYIATTGLFGVTCVCKPQETISGTIFKYSE
jgi:hypothetical protein